jgi:hypothetical protein
VDKYIVTHQEAGHRLTLMAKLMLNQGSLRVEEARKRNVRVSPILSRQTRSDCYDRAGVRYERQKPALEDFVVSRARRIFSVHGADSPGAGRFLQG